MPTPLKPSSPTALSGWLNIIPAAVTGAGEWTTTQATAAAAADPLLGAATTTLGTGLKLAGLFLAGVISYRTNRLASAADDAEKAASATPEQIGANGHLSRMAAKAMRTVIGELAEGKTSGSWEHGALTQAATRAEAAWLSLLNAPIGEHFHKLDSVAYADITAGAALGSVEVLTVEQWLPFARHVLGELSPAALTTATPAPGPAVFSNLARELATRLETDFARHFYGHAKLSLEKDPAAFAALLLQFQADMRFALRQHSADLAHLGTQITSALERLDQMARQAVGATGFTWEKLASHLAEATTAHAEARRFFTAQQQQWDQLLPLAQSTYSLIEGFKDIHEVRATELKQGQKDLLNAVTGIDEWLKEQVRELLAAYRLDKADRESTAAYILGRVLSQQEKPAQVRSSIQSLKQRRDQILSHTARPYQQSPDWAPGPKTRETRRALPPGMLVRPPLQNDSDVPAPGSNYYLFGKSGHGKSTLATAIAQRLARKHYVILFVDLRNETDNVRDKLADLAGPAWLKLAPPDRLIRASQGSGESTGALSNLIPAPDAEGLWPADDQDGRVVAVDAWLHDDRGDDAAGHLPLHPRFCLVWDNVDDPHTLDYILRLHLLTHGGIQIITSRIAPASLTFDDTHPHHEGLSSYECIEVGPYTEAEAKECLRLASEAAVKQGGVAIPIAIVDRLLALARLPAEVGSDARYDPLILGQKIKQGRSPAVCWQERLLFPPAAPAAQEATATPDKAAAPAVPLPPSESEILRSTLATLSPLAQAVWRLLTHFAAAPIPRGYWEPIEDVLRDGEDLTREERESFRDEFDLERPFDRARTALADSGLLLQGDSGDYIHARHITLGRDLVPEPARPALYRQVVRVLYEAAPSGNPHTDLDTWPFYRSAEAHLLTAFATERQADILRLRETGWLTNRFNKFLIYQARLKEAAQIAQVNMDSNAVAYGPDSPELATSLHELARVHLHQGRHAEAEAGFQKALAIYKQHHGESHPSTAATLQVLGSTHLELGRYAEAEIGFQKALAIYVQHHGEFHPSTANALHELARTHLELGRLAEAEAGFQKALAIDVQHHGESHPSTATTLHSLARIHLEQGRHAEAEAGFQKVLAIDVRLQGDTSWEAATTRTHLARVLALARRKKQAYALFQQALNALEAALGPDHWRIALTCHFWAESELHPIPGSARAAKPKPACQQRIQRALAIYGRVYGPNHPDTAQTRLLQAECHRRLGDLPAAAREAQAALTALEKALPAAHPSIAQARKLIEALKA